MSLDDGTQRRLKLYAAAFLFGMLMLQIVFAAWLSDDAYITLRTVENAANGYGLRWNVIERVQVYTHPLWMFLLLGGRLLTGEVFYASYLVSFGCTLAALAVLFGRLSPSRTNTLIGLLLLVTSASFIDYSTSGLENPLSHLLLIIFVWLFISSDFKQASTLFWLSFIGSLAAFNRLDTLAFYGFPVLYAWWQHGRWQGFFALAAGQFPQITWEIFSVIYYGFPVPNTAYAKLASGFPQSEYYARGISYLLHIIHFDPLVYAALFGALWSAARHPDKRYLTLWLGIPLYLLYMVRIGGDFMAGRYFSTPLVLAVVIIVMTWPTEKILAKRLVGLVLITAGLASWIIPLSPFAYPQFIELQGSDEAANYRPSTGLWIQINGNLEPEPSEFAEQGKQLKQDQIPVFAYHSVGFLGFEAGPDTFIIDKFG
ncbi:MAG: hypothetical protein AAF902_13555, partial [Chloroflexota bacterium]